MRLRGGATDHAGDEIRELLSGRLDPRVRSVRLVHPREQSLRDAQRFGPQAMSRQEPQVLVVLLAITYELQPNRLDRDVARAPHDARLSRIEQRAVAVAA